MNITEKLGKAGIPGFRSGKWWKMFLVIPVYFLIAIFLIAFIQVVILGSPQNSNPSPQAVPTATPIFAQAASIATATPIPAPAGKMIVEYSGTSVGRLSQYVLSNGSSVYAYPDPGMTYLVITLKVNNQGYQMIHVNKFIWNLKVSTKDNPNAYTEATKKFWGEADGIECKDTELENKGYTICKIPFEVPSNYDKYKVFYYISNINIEWKIST